MNAIDLLVWACAVYVFMKSVIYTDNYGRAAAVDFFGRARRLPPAVSGHNSACRTRTTSPSSSGGG